MNKFEKFLLEKGIPIQKVSTPLERLLMRIGLISMPIGLLSYWKRAIWFSLAFAILFVGTVEIFLQLFVRVSFFTLVPREIVIKCVCILLLFGPITAFFSRISIKKHRNALESFLGDQNNSPK